MTVSATLVSGLIAAALSLGQSVSPDPSGLPAGQPALVGDRQIADAMLAIDESASYFQLVTALTKHKDVITTDRAVELVDSQLAMTNLGERLRWLLMVMRQAFVETRDAGPDTAAGRMAVRLIATGAIRGDVEQLTQLLDGFAEFLPKLTEAVITPALAAPDLNWPAPMKSLLVQLAGEWRPAGSRIVATNITSALRRASADAPTGSAPADQRLVGRWQSTRAISTGSQDTDLELEADGTARMWATTADGKGDVSTGRWTSRGGMLTISWGGGTTDEAPYTVRSDELIFPDMEGAQRIFARLP